VRVEAVCWDWNGTLLDDVEICREAMNRVLTENGRPVIDDLDAYRHLFRFPIPDFYADLGLGGTAYHDAASRYLDLVGESAPRAGLQPGARDALNGLAERGMQQILASATPAPTLMAQLEPHHLASVFSEVLSAEDAYHASKREVIASWLGRTGTPAERIVMIGDTNHDLEIAHSLGMQFIHLTSGHQSLEGAGVHHIDSLDELDRELGREWQ